MPGPPAAVLADARDGPARQTGGNRTWDTYRAQLVELFFEAFEYLLRPITDRKGLEIPLAADHLRSMVQLCLHLALVVPGRELPRDVVVDQSLTLRRLDDAAVEAMCEWLTAVNGDTKKQRGDGNVVGSASKPSFIAGVEACRRDTGGAATIARGGAGGPGWTAMWTIPAEDRINRILDRIPPDDA